MAEVFATELADHTIRGRHAFSQKLLADTGKYDANPVDKFVLLGGAIAAGKGPIKGDANLFGCAGLRKRVRWTGALFASKAHPSQGRECFIAISKIRVPSASP